MATKPSAAYAAAYVHDAALSGVASAIALRWPTRGALETELRSAPPVVFGALIHATAETYEALGYDFDDRAFVISHVAVWCGFAGERLPRGAKWHRSGVQYGREIRRMVAEYQAAFARSA